jgi:hypothetical protein
MAFAGLAEYVTLQMAFNNSLGSQSQRLPSRLRSTPYAVVIFSQDE